MKREFYFFILFIAVSFVMISCGGKKTETTATNTTTVASTPAAPSYKTMTADMLNGKKIYAAKCIACHLTGVGGAPALQAGKIDKAVWQAKADKGIDTLVAHAIKGYTTPGTTNIMPPKGTCVECTDKDLFDAISYMYDQAGAKFK